MEVFSTSPTVSTGPLSDDRTVDGDGVGVGVGVGASAWGRPSPAAPSWVVPDPVTSLAVPVCRVSAVCGTVSPEDGT
ncbi:hypothetical protein [Streptomyces sp. NPDC056632]|uniref:hypothetical protein n=1 Tax=Streptomyces sp. NPDC056632 TaxID=3345884 RepID=UPI0036B97CE4